LEKKIRKNKKKIVICDDNRELCHILQAIVEGEGYKVDFVYDGFALITYLKENQDVDVVILDLIMPDKGGASIFDTVRSVSPASKVIIYTGYSSYETSIYAREADAYLNKTDDTQKLLKVIEELME